MNIGARLRGGAMADSNLVARLRAVTANSLICREAADALAEQAETIQRLTAERNEWAAKWHKVRAELAELKYPGMKGIIRPADDPASPVSR